MKTVEVQGMNCGHCVKKITQAINRLDPQAVVKVDLSNRQVNIDHCHLPDEKIENAINEAGYIVASQIHEA